ncbi:hypothetical protein TALC_00920 [Thermoplasmatales archaeon BRNA1]|nr:hypothetical protein TALC_00920 [Thermoplasmatales archaeon BRNA1]
MISAIYMLSYAEIITTLISKSFIGKFKKWAMLRIMAKMNNE